MSEFRRRLMMSGRALPYDAELEYLQSDGTQFIDTGIIPKLNYRLDCEFYLVSPYGGGDATATFMGCFTGWNNEAFMLVISPNATKTGYNCIGNRSSSYANNVYWNGLLDSWHYLSFRNKSTYIDNVRIIGPTNGSGEPTCNLYLFRSNFNNTGTYGVGTQKRIKSASLLTNDNELLLDLIPVRVGNVGYMYDKVSGRLFGNAGTGNFTIGADKSGSNYTEYTYIINTGNAYISTGIYADSNTYIEIGFKNNEPATSNIYPYPFGRRVRLDYGRYGLFYNGYNSEICYGYNNEEYSTNVPWDTDRHDVKFGNGKVIIDDTEVGVLQGTFTSNTHPLLLFTENANNTTVPDANYRFRGNIYYCKIYQSGILVRDYVPALRNQDGIAGMLDKVNGVFYGSLDNTLFGIG